MFHGPSDGPTVLKLCSGFADGSSISSAAVGGPVWSMTALSAGREVLFKVLQVYMDLSVVLDGSCLSSMWVIGNIQSFCVDSV